MTRVNATDSVNYVKGSDRSHTVGLLCSCVVRWRAESLHVAVQGLLPALVTRALSIAATDRHCMWLYSGSIECGVPAGCVSPSLSACASQDHGQSDALWPHAVAL